MPLGTHWSSQLNTMYSLALCQGQGPEEDFATFSENVTWEPVLYFFKVVSVIIMKYQK